MVLQRRSSEDDPAIRFEVHCGLRHQGIAVLDLMCFIQTCHVPLFGGQQFCLGGEHAIGTKHDCIISRFLDGKLAV